MNFNLKRNVTLKNLQKAILRTYYSDSLTLLAGYLVSDPCGLIPYCNNGKTFASNVLNVAGLEYRWPQYSISNPNKQCLENRMIRLELSCFSTESKF